MIKIKMWMKKAIDKRSQRSEPGRRLIAKFDKELCMHIPVPIYHDVIVSAIEIMKICVKQYDSELGKMDMKTVAARVYIEKLTNQIPESHYIATSAFSSMTSLLFSNLSKKLSRNDTSKSKKVYPEDLVDVEVEKEDHPVIINLPSIQRIRSTREVLVEIDESIY